MTEILCMISDFSERVSLPAVGLACFVEATASLAEGGTLSTRRGTDVDEAGGMRETFIVSLLGDTATVLVRPQSRATTHGWMQPWLPQLPDVYVV